jgi:nitroreductase
MNFFELSAYRQSIRKYNPDRPVGRDVIDRCLETARLAPSACNSQPWKFYVLDQDPVRSRLARAAFSGAYKMNGFAEAAPVLIVVARERSRLAARLGGMFRGTVYSLIDIGIACEHLCLQAEEEGLGACMLGWLNEKAVKQMLHIPRSSKVDMIISMGYPVEDMTRREKKRKSLDEIRTFIQGNG